MTLSPKNRLIFGTLTIALSLASIVLFVPWGIVTAYLSPLPETVPEQLEQAVDNGLDGVIVYIHEKGQAPELYAAGWHDRVQKIPANPKALFKIASVSKLYVAVAAAKMAQAEQLSLDKTLNDYLPSLAGRIEYSDEITLRMLIQHRSGIPNYTDSEEFDWANAIPEESLKLVLDEPALFKPNKRYKYSNTNYLLLGMILDNTLGYSHHRYVQEEILTPLGLKHTFSLQKDVDPNKLMSGYDTGYDFDFKDFTFVSPSGSMIAKAQDTGVFLRALNEGTLLSDAEQEIYSSLYSYEHTGLLPGYSTIARYHKDTDTVIILFANTSGGETWGIFEVVYDRVHSILKRRK